MAAKTAGLLNFERQLNAAFPHRKGPDGWIADSAHGISGHQPDDVPGSKAEWNGDPDNIPDVRAVDLALDLGDPDVSFQDLVDHIVKLPKLATVVRYVIYAGKIYHERAGFKPAKYTGADQHFGHGHVSFAWSEAADDNTTYDYRFEEIPVALTAADKTWITAQINAAVTKLATDNTAKVDDLLVVRIGDKANPGRTVGDVLRDLAKLRGYLVGDPADSKNAALAADAPAVKVVAVLGTLEREINDIKALLAAA